MEAQHPELQPQHSKCVSEGCSGFQLQHQLFVVLPDAFHCNLLRTVPILLQGQADRVQTLQVLQAQGPAFWLCKTHIISVLQNLALLKQLHAL